MEIQVYFKTSKFEDKEVANDQTGYAILLAEWFCSALPSEFKADFIDEDWGCSIVLTNEYYNKLELICGHVDNTEYSICINTKKGFFDNLLSRDPFIDEANQLKGVVQDILDASNELTDVQWVENG